MAKLRQELSDTASLHASVRRGQPTIAQQLLLERGSAGQLPRCCLLSPSGAAAALLWKDAGPGSGPHTAMHGIQPARSGAAKWLEPVPGADLGSFTAPLAMRWHPAGRYMGSLLKVSCNTMAAHVWDAEQSRWLSCTFNSSGADSLDRYAAVRFSDCEGPVMMAVQLLTGPDNSSSLLLVFAVDGDRVQLCAKVPVQDDRCAFDWLHGRPRLVILSGAQFDLSSADIPATAQAVEVQPQHAALDIADARSIGDICLSMLPHGRVALLCVTSIAGYTDRLRCLLLLLDSELQQLFSRRTVVSTAASAEPAQHVALELHGACRVLASPHVLVASLNKLGIWMYQLQGPATIGRLICVVPHFGGTLAFSPGGHFLARFMDCELAVLDGKTGALILRMPPVDFWPGLRAAARQGARLNVMAPVRCMWRRPNQLLAVAREAPPAHSFIAGEWLHPDDNSILWLALQFQACCTLDGFRLL